MRYRTHWKNLFLPICLGNALLLTQFTGSECHGQTSTKINFARDIQPILAQNCWTCHGPDEKGRKADLRLDHRESAIQKKAILPGDWKKSGLIQRIESTDTSEQMPPPETKKSLSVQQKQLLKSWIQEGANYSRHWAFIPPTRLPIPVVKDSSWARNPIDAFILLELDKRNMKPSDEADPATLLRRLTLDLTGLPPTKSQILAFLEDKSPGAYEKVVDQLLASPAHAERMAMAWLDAARYADTNGFNNDEDRTQWPWRDWVIEAYRNNMPFDRFLTEQIAGDLLPDSTLNQKVATGFLRNQVHNTEGGIIPEEYRVEYVADRVHTVATVFMGLSLQCARCHDHKYDPISQREYYQFFGFFGNVSDKVASYSNFFAAEPFVRVPNPEQKLKQAELEKAQRILENQIKQKETDAGALAEQWVKSLSADRIQTLLGLDLALHLKLDETTGNTIHSADGTAVGTVRGQAKWSPGKLGNALDFDGSTHAEIASAPEIEGDTPFSFSLWCLPPKGGSVALLSKMDDLAAHRGYDILLEEGKVVVHLVHHWPDQAIKVIGRKPLTSTDWHHILVTYNGSRKANGLKIYIDGQPESVDIASDSLKSSIKTDKRMHLGRRQSSLYYRGKLDDIRIYRVELTVENARQFIEGNEVILPGSFLNTPAEKRSDVQKRQLRQYYLDRVDADYSKFKTDLNQLVQKKLDLEKTIPPVMVMEELSTPREVYVLKRGQYDQRGEKVSFGVPGVMPPWKENMPRNRLGLAQWLVQPENPLTARVAVNRLWQMIFGTGLVKTVEDFGLTGEYPSHPELLDYLATDFMEYRWDVKRLIKLMVTSAVYRQSSRMTPAHQEQDPENRFLARGARYRLPAETIRDQALTISGLLRESIGGPSVKPYQPGGLWEDVTVERRGHYIADKGDNLYRRSMYTFWKRTCPPPALMTFDAPNREVCLARRAITNTPLQALVLLNDPTYMEAARKFAERILQEGGNTIETKIGFGMVCTNARIPTSEEIKVLMEILDKARQKYRNNPQAAQMILQIGDSPANKQLDPIELAAWSTVAATLLNLDATISRR